jgi:hypothetical protein
MTSKRYIPLKIYNIMDICSVPDLGEEYIIDDPHRGVKRWCKVCPNLFSKPTPTHHRIDGPARITTWGEEWWMVEGKFHRTDGPALTFPGDRYEWWVTGSQAKTFQQFQEMTGHSDAKIIMFKLKYGDIIHDA